MSQICNTVEYMVKMVNATSVYQKTGGVNNLANVFVIYDHIYSLLFIYLRHIWKEQICANSVFSSRVDIR